ncbi:MAG: 3-hydroxybutyryl-CoA dehydratase [Rhodospirillaceae bacterium]|nr:3-hydroxybutyryl-CoA dehydratase [Rhodospirillaceae bacterium]
MLPMPIGDLNSIAAELTESKGRIKVLWQQPESLAFVARGREYRSEFHIDPVDEVMYMIKGEMNLHYRMPDGSEEVTILKQGCSIYTAAGIPHSPRFSPDAFLLVIERQRRDGEVDRFQWYCPECDELLHEEQFIVNDYRSDPVSKAYANFFNSLERRTCRACGHIMPNPL